MDPAVLFYFKGNFLKPFLDLSDFRGHRGQVLVHKNDSGKSPWRKRLDEVHEGVSAVRAGIIESSESGNDHLEFFFSEFGNDFFGGHVFGRAKKRSQVRFGYLDRDLEQVRQLFEFCGKSASSRAFV